MIAHLAPSVNVPVEAFTSLGEDGEPCQAVGIVVIDVFSTVTARGYVIETTGEFETEGTGHEGSLGLQMLYCKTSYLAKTDELCCSSDVVSVGQDDAGKT